MSRHRTEPRPFSTLYLRLTRRIAAAARNKTQDQLTAKEPMPTLGFAVATTKLRGRAAEGWILIFGTELSAPYCIGRIMRRRNFDRPPRKKA